MKLSEIKSILESRKIGLTRSLGQNFLHDQNQLRRIVEQARLGPGASVLEIGPGLGPLTTQLLGEGARVLAIEKDHRLVDFLREHFAGNQELELIPGDALVYLREHRSWSRWKLVSNLPYSVASPILVELALSAEPPERMVATLQLEVARRLMAEPRQSDYGLLTVLVQNSFVPENLFKISASCFFPAPDVDSACLTLARRDRPLVDPPLQPSFQKIARLGFSQRRKMMAKLLKQNYPVAAIENAFGELGLKMTVRAEEVAVEQFAELTRILHRLEPAI